MSRLQIRPNRGRKIPTSRIKWKRIVANVSTICWSKRRSSHISWPTPVQNRRIKRKQLDVQRKLRIPMRHQSIRASKWKPSAVIMNVHYSHFSMFFCFFFLIWINVAIGIVRPNKKKMRNCLQKKRPPQRHCSALKSRPVTLKQAKCVTTKFVVSTGWFRCTRTESMGFWPMKWAWVRHCRPFLWSVT